MTNLNLEYLKLYYFYFRLFLETPLNSHMYDPLRDTRVAKATAQEPLGDIQLLPAFTLEQAKIKSNVP